MLDIGINRKISHAGLLMMRKLDLTASRLVSLGMCQNRSLVLATLSETVIVTISIKYNIPLKYFAISTVLLLLYTKNFFLFFFIQAMFILDTTDRETGQSRH